MELLRLLSGILRVLKEMYKKSINKILKSSSLLLSGNVISSILSLLVVSILTKNLSLEEYGIIVMVQAYIMLVDQLFNFQSWQALIKYSTEAIESNNTLKFIGYLQIGIFLDLLGSLIAFIASFILLSPLSFVLKIDYNLLSPYMIFATVILTRIIGTPTALLRLSNSYKYFNYSLLLNWGLKLLLIAIIAFLNILSIYNVIIVFLVSEILSNLLLIYYGMKTLKKYQISLLQIIPSWKTIYFAKQNIRFLHFAFKTNMNSAVLGITRTIDELIVGALLSPAGAGIFKIIKLMGTIISKVLDPLYITFYPEINIYVAKGDNSSILNIIKKMSLYSGIISLLIFVVFYLFGKSGIELFFTKDYLVGLPVMYLYLIGLLISFTFFYTQPLMLAYELEGIALYINIICSIFYLLFLYILTVNYGLMGIAISFILFWILITLLKMLYIQKNTYLFFHRKG